MQRTELLLDLEKVNDENKELNVLLEAAQQESDIKFKEISEIEQECEDLELEITRSNKLQASKREEATELKKKHNELKDQLATAKLDMQEKQAEVESLRAKVVSSPDRRKREVGNLKNTVEEEKHETQTLEEDSRNKKTELVRVQNAVQHVLESSSEAEGVLDSIERANEAEATLKAARIEAATIRSRTEALLEKLEERKRELNRTDEKLSQMRKQSKLRMDAAQEAIDSAKAQLLEVEREHLEGVAKVEAGETEVKAMEAQIEDEKQKTKQEVVALIDRFRAVEKRCLEKNTALMAAIEAS